MNKRLFSLLALTMSLCAAAEVSAESTFTNHIDLFQVSTARGGQVTVADFGYHFTALRVCKRVGLLGAGIALDLYSKDGPEYMQNNVHGSFIVVVPIMDVALKNPDDVARGNPWVSFGARYGYNLDTRDHGILVGFAISFR